MTLQKDILQIFHYTERFKTYTYNLKRENKNHGFYVKTGNEDFVLLCVCPRRLVSSEFPRGQTCRCYCGSRTSARITLPDAVYQSVLLYCYVTGPLFSEMNEHKTSMLSVKLKFKVN